MDSVESSPVVIRPELHPYAVPIDTVQPWSGNPRRGALATIRDSLTEHGQFAPLLVQQATGNVIKGNNTLHAMRELGATHVAVQRIEVDDDRARRILTIDNRSTDQASYDEKELAALLSGLDDLTGTGWTTDELDDILRATGAYAEQASAFLSDFLDSDDSAHGHSDSNSGDGQPPAGGGDAAASPTEPTSDQQAGDTAQDDSEKPQLKPGQAYTTGDGVTWVTVQWTATLEQRDTIRQAITLAQRHFGLSTSVEALAAICDTYRKG